MNASILEIPTDWKDIILKYPKINEVSTFLEKESEKFSGILEILPRLSDIFKCFTYFNSENTKVVILGQDPYHGLNQATGLCFAVNDGQKSPPSLNNIKNELVTDIGVDLPTNTLKHWAKQGILLLNSALTVRQKSPASHMSIWLPFTKYIIDYINRNCQKVIFVAWGAFAYDKLKDVDKEKHHLIVSSHPSPLSARRKFKTFPSFLGSKPFSKINSYLEKKIIW